MQNAKRTPPHTDGVVVMFVVIIILYKKRLVNTQNYEILYKKGGIFQKIQ